jgi:hypothetical protein
MTSEQTAGLITAVVTLLVTLNTYLGLKVRSHEQQLNGKMDARIDQRAKAVIANDHALRQESPSPAANAATQARVQALVAELQALDPGMLAAPVVPVVLPK